VELRSNFFFSKEMLLGLSLVEGFFFFFFFFFFFYQLTCLGGNVIFGILGCNSKKDMVT